MTTCATAVDVPVSVDAERCVADLGVRRVSTGGALSGVASEAAAASARALLPAIR